MRKGKGRATTEKTEFVKPTISLPAELWPWAEARKADPQHAGSLSSYIRSLIIADRESRDVKEAA